MPGIIISHSHGQKSLQSKERVAVKKRWWILIAIHIIVFGIYISLRIWRVPESEGSGVYDALTVFIHLAAYVIYGLIIIDVIIGLIWVLKARRE